MYEDIPVINNESIHHFEMRVEGRLAFIEYKQHDDKLFLIHTEVPRDMQGQGIAAALVEKTFQYLEAHHLKMVPYCAYIKAYLQKHPEWERLVG